MLPNPNLLVKGFYWRPIENSKFRKQHHYIIFKLCHITNSSDSFTIFYLITNLRTFSTKMNTVFFINSTHKRINKENSFAKFFYIRCYRKYVKPSDHY